MISLQSMQSELDKIKLNDQINDNNLCNICSQPLLPDDTIKLQCHHEYHYECIKAWYKKTMENVHGSASSKSRECPYCRKSGGYLPLREGDQYMKDIHSPKQWRPPSQVIV